MQSANDGFPVGRGHAWFAFAMTVALMLFDYIDRQVVVSLFPHIKADWGLADAELGALVSVISITVALGALPVALLADRRGRVKSIVVMALVWSLASISCMFSRNYGQLLAARAAVGLGEAGYGSAGAALIASLFPERLRAALLAAFFATASVGSVLGVVAGGAIAAQWGWQAAFGVVGVPGLVLAVLYTRVKDYRTVALTPALTAATESAGDTARHIGAALLRTRSLLWICIGAAAQLIVVSAVWAWLPSFLNRVHGVAPGQAGLQASLVVLCGAAGSVLWGHVVYRAGATRPRQRLRAVAALCAATVATLVVAFGVVTAHGAQMALIACGGFLMTCSVGPAAAAVMDVVHPGVRATGAAILALFQNLFGLAVGPFVAGLVSDSFGLPLAMVATSLVGLVAAAAFLRAARSYEADIGRAALIESSEGRIAPIPQPVLDAAR